MDKAHHSISINTDWLPGDKKAAYFDNYDDIKWKTYGEDEGISVKGKAKESDVSKQLNVEETVRAVRTPVLERDHNTFKHVEGNPSGLPSHLD